MSSNKNLTEDLRSVSVAVYIKPCCPSWNISGEPMTSFVLESSKLIHTQILPKTNSIEIMVSEGLMRR